ncbi:MAG: peroxidase family protein [Hyphomicrobiaceae bacterium]|nr:peroxidase family protein [Hyphomicrobiaceae bacterium]
MTTSFIVNLADLNKILDQIKIAERHSAGENLLDVIGEANALLPVGLRTVDGSFNHLLAGDELAGAADQLFPRLLTPEYITATNPDGTTPFFGLSNTNYDPSIVGTKSVVDVNPRLISNLIVDQTLNNKAALAAALLLSGVADPSGVADQIMSAREAAAQLGLTLDALTALAAGLPDGVDAADIDAAADASAAATAAVAAQQALVDQLGAGPTHPAAILLASLTTLASDIAALSGSLVLGDLDTGAELTATNAALAGASPLGSTADTTLTTMIVDNGLDITPDGSVLIENRSPDIGLSPPNSGWMTLFGQFFDHGLDLVTKGGPGTGTVFVPLLPDDPLIAGADGKFGTADDLAPELRFMALTRATRTQLPGLDGVMGTADDTFEARNTTTPFVDQNQTYTSHASHQVFLREYKFTEDTNGDNIADSRAVNTGRLLDGANGGIANWGEVKAQALEKLGIVLTDFDVHNVPLLRTDAYGKFIAGPNGYAQMITGAGLDGIINTADDDVIEGSAAGTAVTAAVLRTGHAFLDDIAHHAAPGVVDTNNDGIPDTAQVADSDTDSVADDGNPLTYDNEMLEAHFITGDGRGNENIGLTAVHTVFHAEHNRLVEANKLTILRSGELNTINEWLATDLADLTGVPPATADDATLEAFAATLNWDGERLFQAARFATEMQYQHLVFEEFARRLQPNVDPFVFTNSADLDPAIVAEFAHTVYRFGHSMLTDSVDRLDNDLTTVNSNGTGNDAAQIGLIAAFLNPQAFTASAGTLGPDSDAIATGAIVRGMSRQVGGEIDEFVVEALRNNLLGLPLDLPALNIARGRDTGIPSLNHAREQLYAMTGATDVKPYTSWIDFSQHIKHPLSVVNFIAAYGTHTSITSATTLDAKRDAALKLVIGDASLTGQALIDFDLDRLDFLNARGAYAGGLLGGLNSVDMWIGGLAEELNEFGGQLGSTFNFVFEYQMEHLQNGDRFYYLSRTQGMNLLNVLEPNTFADIIMRNTDLGDLHATHLPALIMTVPDMILELDPLATQDNYGPNAAASIDINAPGYDRSLLDPVWDDAFQQAIDPKVVRQLGAIRVDGNGDPILDAAGQVIRDGNLLTFSGGEHVVLGGTEGNDSIYGDKGIDTLWGDGGNDYLNAGMESDNVFGGDGDDIIEDPFGDDFLRGEGGNDVILADLGLDLMFGGEGQDFIWGATDTKEVFAGPGNDFILGGTAPDVLMGNEGDDWIEGGEGFDGLSGENSELFFNSPIVGHDILWGQGNDTDYDGENGDDIMVQGAGIQRNNGMEGFDWAIHKGDNVAADSDLTILIGAPVTPPFILRDRFDSVEGLSGWKFDDKLTGATKLVGPGAGFIGNLTQAGVDRIQGLAAVIAPMAEANPTNDPNAILLPDATFAQLGGEIILGGAGNDTITGNLGDDILDGDAWLNVRIAVMSNPDGTGTELYSVDSLTSTTTTAGTALAASIAAQMASGQLNPGQLKAVREILYDDATDGTNPADTSIDTAVFSGLISDYTITQIGANSLRVVDDRNAAVGGGNLIVPDSSAVGDILHNFELLQFADGTFTFEQLTAGQPQVTGPATLTSDEDVTFDITIFDFLQNVTDPNGDPLSVINVTVDRGTVVDNLDGTWTYTPLANDDTAAVFSYQVTDGLFEVNHSLQLDLLPVNDAPTGAVTFTNTPAGSGTLVATNTIQDVDGLLGPVTYQWQVSTDGGTVWTDILGATDASFTPVAEIGQLLRVTAISTDAFGTVQTPSALTTVIGDDNANVLNGSSTDNLVVARGSGDQLFGAGGLDTLNGGAGADTLNGGADADVLNGGAGTDTASYVGSAAGVTVSLQTNVGTGGDAEGDTLNSIESLIGSSQGDVLTGNNANNILDGGLGSDTMNGGNGNDTYWVDVITDVLGDTGGTDLIRSSITWTLAGGFENLMLEGTLNIDGTGNGADNSLIGNDGANVLSGLGGSDRMFGQGGNDTYVVNDTGDVVGEVAANGTDTVQSSITYTLGAEVEKLLLTGNGNINGNGNGLDNVIVGNNGSNRIDGLAGQDNITGGLGRDFLWGGTENDRFVYLSLAHSNGTNAGRDRIVDFTAGDTIWLDALIDANADVAGSQQFTLDTDGSFSAGEIRQTLVGANLLVEMNTNATAGAEMSLLLLNRNTLLTTADFGGTVI